MTNNDVGSPASAASAALVGHIERGMEANHGVMLDHWIRYLLRFDVSERAEQLTNSFAAELSNGSGGLVGRVARKFAVLYAAAVIGIDAGLLPWTEPWVRFAVMHIYQEALAIRDPDAAKAERIICRLRDCLADPARFPRVPNTSRGVPEFDLGDRSIGFVVRDGERGRPFLIPDRLQLIGVEGEGFQRRIADQIKARRTGSTAFSSRQYRVRDSEGERRKVRAWPLSVASMDQVAERCRSS